MGSHSAALRVSCLREDVPAVLELVGLAGKEDRLPHQLSGGEQQRVSVARAFVNRPLIMLADEPTGNLDPDLSLEVMRIFRRFNEVGVTLLVASHDIALIDKLGCRRIELEDGRLQGMRFEKVMPEYDEQGKRKLVPTGEEPVVLECDEVLLAIGQQADAQVFPPRG